MSRTGSSKPTHLIAMCLAVWLAAIHLSAQSAQKFETFTATTTNMAVGNDETIRINVSTWTPEPERQKFVALVQEKGEEALVEMLKSAPSAGYIWTSENLGYTLRYAHRLALPDGGERIVLATDLPLGRWSRTAWKAAGSEGRSSPLTLMELRLNRSGRGEGKMSLAAPIGAEAETRTLALQTVEKAPVLLKQVQRVKESGTR